MSANQKLLAAWKLCLSFTKPQWELADYPVVIRQQRVEEVPKRPLGRGTPQRFTARIVNWWVMTGLGDTEEQAMADLTEQFGRMKDTKYRDGKPMPRPGANVPIEFAASNRIQAHAELCDEFIRLIFDLEWAFVSDESSLWDFHDGGTNDSVNSKIKQVYGVDVSDVTSGNLAEILDRIATRQTR